MKKSSSTTYAALLAIIALCLASPAWSQAPRADSKVRRDTVSGRVHTVTGTSQAPTSTPFDVRIRTLTDAEVSSSMMVTVAKKIMSQSGRQFGVGNVLRELNVTSVKTDSLGMKHVGFEQVYRGIPVFAAELIVHINADNTLSSITGAFVPRINIPTRPMIGEDVALEAAEAIYQVEHPQYQLQSVKLVILSTELLENKAFNQQPLLAYAVNLAATDPAADDILFIDANSGELVYQLNQLRQLSREVKDCSYNPSSGACYMDVVSNGYRYGRSEGQSECGLHPEFQSLWCDYPALATPKTCPANYDTDEAYDNLGIIHSYYTTTFGRDGANDQGGLGCGSIPRATTPANVLAEKILSSADYKKCSAYFNKSGGCTLNFCTDSTTLDVVAHEYAHGVAYWTHYSTNGMTYVGESASVEESHSDIIGEFVSNYMTGSADWKLDGGSIRGIIRHLYFPYASERGGNYQDRNYSFITGTYACNGTNNYLRSTIMTKAFFLMADGGYYRQHNLCKITPIGYAKAEQILHRAMAVYFPASVTLNSAYSGIMSACNDLYGAGSADCINVMRALQSVEMDQPGSCTTDQTAPPACAEPTKCIDSDSGEDFLTPGQVMVAGGPIAVQPASNGHTILETKYYNDYCVLDRYAVEHSCDAATDSVRQNTIQCPLGCLDGACIPCKDTDGGITPETAGVVEDFDGQYQDSCQSTTTLTENFCDDGLRNFQSIECAEGEACVDGACGPVDDQCPDDPDKIEPGVCGCGVPDADGDGDGTADCIDACPNDPTRWQESECSGAIVARQIFYRGSSFGSAAVASDKQPLLPGHKASFVNYTSYSRGINSVLVDIAGLPEGATLSASDFNLMVGNSSNFAAWIAAPAPTSITVSAGAGVNGSAQIELIWGNNVIQKQWLRIEVLANANSGLQEPDVFYFGNAIGEVGNSASNAIVNATDQLLIRQNASGLTPVPVTNRYDMDRNKLVNATDVLIARNNTSGTNPLLLITAP